MAGARRWCACALRRCTTLAAGLVGVAACAVMPDQRLRRRAHHRLPGRGHRGDLGGRRRRHVRDRHRGGAAGSSGARVCLRRGRRIGRRRRRGGRSTLRTGPRRLGGCHRQRGECRDYRRSQANSGPSHHGLWQRTVLSLNVARFPSARCCSPPLENNGCLPVDLARRCTRPALESSHSATAQNSRSQCRQRQRQRDGELERGLRRGARGHGARARCHHRLGGVR